jgi:hypothetical protein
VREEMEAAGIRIGGAELERTLSTISTSSRRIFSGKKRNPTEIAGNSDELYRSTSITSEDCREHEEEAKIIAGG